MLLELSFSYQREVNMDVKSWKSVGVYTTFEEADQKRNELKEKFDLVKVKRCGRGGNLFRVKTWKQPPPPKKRKNEPQNQV